MPCVRAHVAPQTLMGGDAPYSVIEPVRENQVYADLRLLVTVLLAIWSLSRLYVMARSA